ncbi:protein SRC2-like [Telopea speciosissima]|uniref:protein SRC2-like n=1 Tax=Telopea speciosissima TaxID=54955 RepID=UPI001CC6A869|nr:protein SRC2-like [Telopea speciosissima]
MASYDYQYQYPKAPMEVKVTVTSAKDLKNVNWRHGALKPYAVIWVDSKSKCTTNVDGNGDTSPNWDETLVLPLIAPIEDAVLFTDIVHANADEDTKPLIGSARVPLKEILDDVGIGESASRKLQLRRPSGRPQGKLEIKVVVRDTHYRAPDPYYAPPYGVPPPAAASRDYASPYGNPYAPPPPVPSYAATPPPSGYPAAYGATAYGQPASYGQPAAYEQPPVEEKKKKSKYGIGTGLAVGAVGGVLGGLALAEGVDYVEDKIEDHVVEKVEEDLGYDQDGFY